jgi:hypothetical protein
MPLPMNTPNYLGTLHLEPLLGRHPHSSGLDEDRTISGLWDGFPTGVSGLQPYLLGSENCRPSIRC